MELRRYECLLLLTIALPVVLPAIPGNISPKSYSNYVVYRARPTTALQVAALGDLRGKSGFDFWTPVKLGHEVDVMVSPAVQTNFQSRMTATNVVYKVLQPDVQAAIEAEKCGAFCAALDARNRVSGLRFPRALHPRRKSQTVSLTRRHIASVNQDQLAEKSKIFATRISPENDMVIDDSHYLRYNEMLDYIDYLAMKYPQRVRVHDIGMSYEKRPMKVVQLSNCFYCNYSAVWIDAGMHAREWIAPAVAMHTLRELAENPKNDDMLNNLDWFILPVVNPDGYEYTHTTDRMWRKTRSPSSIEGCMGADPNRNFDFHWKEVGASSYPCSETFAGKSAFSEIEAQNVRLFLWTNRLRFRIYLTYHSYGNYLLYPWGYTEDLPRDWEELDNLAHKVNEAMVAAGSDNYTIGSSTNTLYAAAGGSDDWAKGIAGIPLSYTIELPGYTYGFQLPPRYIDPVATQSFEGLRAFGQHIQLQRGRVRVKY